AAGGTEAPHLAHGILREVVMQQEATFDLTLFKVVYELLVIFRAERRGNDGLRLAAREKRRAVNARQPADFACDRTNLREAATVGSTTLVQDVVAEDSLLKVIEDALCHQALFGLVFGI